MTGWAVVRATRGCHLNQLHDSRIATFSQPANPPDLAQRYALATAYQIILDSPLKRIRAALTADGYAVRSGQVNGKSCQRLIDECRDARREKLITDLAECFGSGEKDSV